MSSTMPSGTRSPLSRNRLTCWPRSVSRATWPRSRSPVAICGTPKCSAMSRPCVPLPAPGAASINTRKASSLEQGMNAPPIPHPAVRDQQTVRPTLLRRAGEPSRQPTKKPSGRPGTDAERRSPTCQQCTWSAPWLTSSRAASRTGAFAQDRLRVTQGQIGPGRGKQSNARTHRSWPVRCRTRRNYCHHRLLGLGAEHAGSPAALGSCFPEESAAASPKKETPSNTWSAPSSSPSALADAAPAASTTGCLVPDLLDATSANAAALVQSAGFQSVVVTAKTFPGNSSTSPGNFPAGFVWGTNPAETTRTPCGSTVTVYYQP